MKSLFKLEKKDYFNLSEIRVFMYKTISAMPKIYTDDFKGKIPYYEYTKLKQLSQFDYIFKDYFKELFVKTEDLTVLTERHYSLIKNLISKRFTVNTLTTIYYYISNMLIDKITEKYGDNDDYNKYIISAKKLLGSDLHILSSSLYKEIEELKNQRRTSLDKNFFQILNSSVSDKFNNYISSFKFLRKNFKKMKKFFDTHYRNQLDIINNDYNKDKIISSFDYYNKQKDNYEKIYTEMEKEESVETEVDDFFKNYSKMFSGINSNYESEIDNHHLIYILKYIIINGFKVKSIIINSDLENIMNKNFKIKMHEISLLKSLYVLITNASEHNSTEISIKTTIDYDDLHIDVINNGNKIDELALIMMFEPFFTIKIYKEYINNRKKFLEENNIYSFCNENTESYGYGLNIAREELNKFDSNVFLLKSDLEETIFRITIKIKKKE